MGLVPWMEKTVPLKGNDVRSVPSTGYPTPMHLTLVYAPVTVSDGEALGSDDEDKGDESDDTENGTKPRLTHFTLIAH